MTENLPDLEKEVGTQVQEAQRVPNEMKPRRPAPRHSIIKTPKKKNYHKLDSLKQHTVLFGHTKECNFHLCYNMMDLEYIMLSEISQTQMDKSHMIPLLKSV